MLIQYVRPSVKSVYQKINFLISQPKYMLWVLKRTLSLRRFFLAPKTYVQTDGLENIYKFTLNNVCLSKTMICSIELNHFFQQRLKS